MRYILTLLFILIFNGCDNKVEVRKDVANTQVENEKAEIIFQKKCQRCHGIKGGESALNITDVIANYNKKELKRALTLYQKSQRDRHRFGSLMTGIIKDLSKDEIRILADYISNFKEKK
jgi:cytochrome c553